MIKEIRFENWKSFKNATLYIDPLTILIGANSSGKSNLIDGIQMLQQIIHKVDIKTALTSIRGGMEGAVLKSESSFKITCVYEDILGLEYTNEIEYTINPPTFKQVGDQPPDYQNLPQIFILNPIPSNMRSHVALSDELATDASNLAGFLAKLNHNDKQKIEATLQYYLTQLSEKDIIKIWAKPVGELSEVAMLYAEEAWIQNQSLKITAQSMSDGTLRFIAILVAILTRPEGSQLIIEEVDNGLHPSRIKLLLEILQKIGQERHIDVLVTTHNPALLNMVTPDLIPFITVAHRDSQTGYSTLTLLEDIKNLSKLMCTGQIGDLMVSGKIESELSKQ